MPNLSEILACACGLLLIACLSLGIVVAVEHEKVATLQTANLSCEADNKSMKAAADEQNALVDEYQKTSTQITKAANDALAQAQKNSASLSQKIANLQAAKSSTDACASAHALFKQYRSAK